MDLTSALRRLATYRAHNTRASQQIFKDGLVVLNNNATWKLGDDGWEFLEQLALASLDVGRIDVADRCLQLLTERFPGSPRVECLQGLRIEATESTQTALTYYDQLLEADGTKVAIWKRRISVLRRMGDTERAVKELKELLDTFYTDVEGWLELADIYCSCNQYAYALQSLSHVLLLNPQNPYYVLQTAETAYTAGDIPLSIKMFLVVIDMTDENQPKATPRGISVRAWYGVSLCAIRMESDPRLSSISPSSTSAPTHLKLLWELACERLRAAYSGSKDSVSGGRALAWLRTIP